MTTPHHESVLSRTARILEAFSQDEPALTVSDLARRTGLHVATASRYVAELEAHGFLGRDGDRKVRIGVRLWELVTRASPTLSLRDAAMPFMEGVHDVVGHHVQLGVLDGDDVLFLERLSAPNAVVNYTRVAGRLPLYASSSGLVLLAHGPADLKERVLAGRLTAYTPAAPATPARLRVALAEIRRRGIRLLPRLEALAVAFPLRVFPDAVGLEPEGRENLLAYGNMAFNAFGPVNELVTADAHRAAGLTAWVNARCAREALGEDGFGARVWAAADRGELTHEQAPLVVRSLLTAGVDTTVHGLAATLHAFAAHPDEWQRLRERPGLARVAFDEAVRRQSPVQTFFRTATTDVTIAGTVVPEGSKVLMFLGSANRDPARWTDPDRFDLTRDPSGHVGFGMGIHQCVGQHVARLEAETLLTALVRKVDRIEPNGDPRRHLNNTLRSWASLPVRIRPAA